MKIRHLRHPRFVEWWIDHVVSDPPPVMQEVPERDPGNAIRKSNDRRAKAWEKRQRPYFEAYFLLISSTAVICATAWAIYTSL